MNDGPEFYQLIMRQKHKTKFTHVALKYTAKQQRLAMITQNTLQQDDKSGFTTGHITH